MKLETFCELRSYTHIHISESILAMHSQQLALQRGREIKIEPGDSKKGLKRWINANQFVEQTNNRHDEKKAFSSNRPTIKGYPVMERTILRYTKIHRKHAYSTFLLFDIFFLAMYEYFSMEVNFRLEIFDGLNSAIRNTAQKCYKVIGMWINRYKVNKGGRNK